MGVENVLGREAVPREDGQDSLDLIAGIDDDGLVGFLIAQDGAIALQCPYGEHLVDHGTSREFRTANCELFGAPARAQVEPNTPMAGKEHSRPWQS
jgi:hypothetical protein